jgi:hypothetical protein
MGKHREITQLNDRFSSKQRLIKWGFEPPKMVHMKFAETWKQYAARMAYT